METQIKTTEPTSNPANLISLAIEKDVDVVKLEKLLELQERWEAKEAKKLFIDALSKFQAEVKEIKKSKTVSFGVGKASYKYAQLSDIDESIKGAMADNGLTKTFHIKEEGGRIHVTCKISHFAGHSEETTMSGAADQTGNKNAIQASGSTITYLQRYTLIGALGLTTADEDNDGRGGSEKKVENASIVPNIPAKDPIKQLTEELIQEQNELDTYIAELKAAKTPEEFKKLYSANIKLNTDARVKQIVAEKTSQFKQADNSKTVENTANLTADFDKFLEGKEKANGAITAQSYVDNLKVIKALKKLEELEEFEAKWVQQKREKTHNFSDKLVDSLDKAVSAKRLELKA